MTNTIHTRFPDGRKEWRLNGLLHRVDGPAITYTDGRENWWIDGTNIDHLSAHERLTHLRAYQARETLS